MKSFSWEDLSPETRARLRALNPTVQELVEEEKELQSVDAGIEAAYQEALQRRDTAVYKHGNLVHRRQFWQIAGMIAFVIILIGVLN